MKSKIVKSKKEVKELPFPKLMKCKEENLVHSTKNLIVLFINEEEGVVVHSETPYFTESVTGNFSSNWDFKKFDTFNGTIKLSN